MKNLILLAFVAIVTVSCSKIKQSEIEGTWKMIEYTSNGNNVLPQETITIEFTSNNTHNTYTDGVLFYSGVYNLDESSQRLTIDNVTYDITNWSGNVMTLELNVQGQNLIYKYEKQ